MSIPYTTWNEERLRLLRELAKTLSAGKVAEQMGLTRNAVIGAMHRNGIATLNSKGPRPRGRYLDPQPDASYVVRKLALPASISKAVLSRREEPAQTQSEKPVLPSPSGTRRGHVMFFDLKQHHCRWITKTGSESDDGIARFCGQTKKPGLSWCPEHAVKVTRPREMGRR